MPPPCWAAVGWAARAVPAGLRALGPLPAWLVRMHRAHGRGLARGLVLGSGTASPAGGLTGGAGLYSVHAWHVLGLVARHAARSVDYSSKQQVGHPP